MLFELATGNLAFRLDENQNVAELRMLLQSLNEFAALMQSILLKHGYVSPHYSYQNLTQLIVILNQNNIITDCTVAPNNVRHNAENLIGKSFLTLLDSSSEKYFTLIHNELITQIEFTHVVHLLFKTPHNLLVPCFCSITRLLSGETIISSVSTILQDLVYDLPRLRNTHSQKPRVTEAETMQQLYDYILSHLDCPLPTLKQLAKLFKINEFDLKHGFRTCFQTSIHHFYNEERLKRAHLMISNTDINLKSVAFANGFTNYTSFYKAFKKRFGYAPGQLLRESDPEQPP